MASDLVAVMVLTTLVKKGGVSRETIVPVGWYLNSTLQGTSFASTVDYDDAVVNHAPVPSLHFSPRSHGVTETQRRIIYEERKEPDQTIEFRQSVFGKERGLAAR